MAKSKEVEAAYKAEGLRRAAIRKAKRKEKRKRKKVYRRLLMCEYNENKVCDGCMDC